MSVLGFWEHRISFAEIFIKTFLSLIKKPIFQLPDVLKSTGEGHISYIIIEIAEKTNIKTI